MRAAALLLLLAACGEEPLDHAWTGWPVTVADGAAVEISEVNLIVATVASELEAQGMADDAWALFLDADFRLIYKPGPLTIPAQGAFYSYAQCDECGGWAEIRTEGVSCLARGATSHELVHLAQYLLDDGALDYDHEDLTYWGEAGIDRAAHQMAVDALCEPVAQALTAEEPITCAIEVL